MAAHQHALLAAAVCLTLGLSGCAGDTRTTATESSPTEAATASTSAEMTQSLSGTLVRDDRGGWYLELEEEEDAERYGASRLSVMTVEDEVFKVTCVNSDEQLELDALPPGTEATVEFKHVLESDPVTLPPSAILAEC